MGNSLTDASPAVTAATTVIKRFYSDKAWIEGTAEDQLRKVFDYDGVTAVAAFPDLHPGKFGPVGVAVASDKIHPALIGNDIGCGMALFSLSTPERKFNVAKASKALRNLADPDTGDWTSMLAAAGFSEAYGRSFGTVGGGNHFCEVLGVDEVLSDDLTGKKGDLFLLVHSGSRWFGEEVFDRLNGTDRFVLDKDGETGSAYMHSHDQCLVWAALNRAAIAKRAASLLGVAATLVVDVPHNLISYEENRFIHRKGAALARPGSLVPVAGSRASLTYLVRATASVGVSFDTISHGAGRKYDRLSMRHRLGRTRSERDALVRNQWGGFAICEDRDALVEEAAQAYKSAKAVVDDLESFDLVKPISALKPLVTFKRADLNEGELDGKALKMNDRRKLRKSKHD